MKKEGYEMKKEISFTHANIEETYQFGSVARQANGSCWLQEGNTVILATVTADTTKSTDDDFLPLTVQYIEKTYAAGRMPGGFIKRESKPSDFETLTSRVIDRSIRPLFPKGYNYPVQVTVMVLSADENADLQRIALNATSAALISSDLPVSTSVTGQRLTKIEGEIVLNPTLSDLSKGSLDLFAAGTKDDLLMIEMRSMATSIETSMELPLIDPMLDPSLAMQMVEVQVDNVIEEEELISDIGVLQKSLQELNSAYEEAFHKIAKAEAVVELHHHDIDEALLIFIETHYRDAIKEALNRLAKSERSTALAEISQKIVANEAFTVDATFDEVEQAVARIKKTYVRQQILDDKVRADGRGLTEVRPIRIETNILPKAHSSVLFTRGETQALAVLTLGGSQDSQMFQNLTDSENQHESLMIHYNFPGFSVGEASRVGPAGRRELGHGNLAKRAVEPTLLEKDKTVRIVSEITESNGSSSMATVCASSLAMRAAKLDQSNLTAGVAMGMVSEGDKYSILTDIMGLEDHDGDMDFKVAGTKEGISAMQMDIKLGGVALPVLKEALDQAKEGRLHILALMEEAANAIEINEGVLPGTDHFVVHPSSIADIIGQGGKIIREIIEKFNVAIDLDRAKGHVKISGTSKEDRALAKEHIRNIVTQVKVEYQEGDVVKGTVKKLVDFGAFIGLPDGQDGLLHISKISDQRISHPSEVLKEGEAIEVRIAGFKGKKIELERV